MTKKKELFDPLLLLLIEELLNLHRGQGECSYKRNHTYGCNTKFTHYLCAGMELYWRDTMTCPTEEEFIEMVDNSKYKGLA